MARAATMDSACLVESQECNNMLKRESKCPKREGAFFPSTLIETFLLEYRAIVLSVRAAIALLLDINS
jgi:hypothetical protein